MERVLAGSPARLPAILPNVSETTGGQCCDVSLTLAEAIFSVTIMVETL
jgi:hypothetical protein